MGIPLDGRPSQHYPFHTKKDCWYTGANHETRSTRIERMHRSMTVADNLQIGLNARLFPNNWRPILNEINFAAAYGFAALQFPGKEDGLATNHLGAEISVVRDSLQQAGSVDVMEINIRVVAGGFTASGRPTIE